MSLEHIDTLISFALVMLLLSLLITTLVEAFNTLLQRRGYNLQWGVAQVLQQMGVGKADAKRYAALVLKHPAVSSSRRVRTSAIRVEELTKLIVDLLKQGKIALETSLAEKFKAAAAGLETAAVAKIGMHRAGELEAVAERVAVLAKDALAADGATTNFDELRSRVANAVKERVEVAARGAAEAALELSGWFSLVMDRSTERFVAATRTVTLVAAVVLCFGFQIDSIRIMERLSTDDELRAALVASAGAVQGEAEGAMLELDASKRLATDALLDVRQALETSTDAREQQLATRIAGEIPELRTPLQARDWLASKVADESERDALLERFGPAMEKRVEARLTRVREIGAKLVDGLKDTQLDLLDVKRISLAGFRTTDGRFDWRHLWGILASVALLNLGAPFWFNTLRSLSNLKPIVARKIDKAEQAEAKTQG